MPLARPVFANSVQSGSNNRSWWWIDRRVGVLMGLIALLVLPILPRTASAQAVRVTCVSRIGQRSECPADTSKGIVLAKAFGEAPCVLGKTWGFDAQGIWVYDGCSGDFLAGPNTPQESVKKGKAEYIPNAGFLFYEGEKGEIYMRVFSYARYLNQ